MIPAGQSKPNSSDFVSVTGTTQGILNTNEKAPLTDEYSASLERQLFPGFAIRVTGIYSRDYNIAEVTKSLNPFSAYTIPVTSQDPGPDGKLGTADDRVRRLPTLSIPPRSADQLPGQYASQRSAAGCHLQELRNRRQQTAVEPVAGDGVYSRTQLHMAGLNAGANPNLRIFTFNNTHEWSAKASGSYQLPFGLLASVNYEVRSGAPWQRTVLASGGITIPTLLVPVEPLGAHYYDNLHLVDGRIRKDLRLFANPSWRSESTCSIS